MAAPIEALLSSDNTGQLWNICAWDPSNGVSLATYKGASSGPRSLDLIQNHYLISAANAKPLIHVWPLHKRQQQDDSELRMVCAGKVTALTVSPDGNYCVAAIAEKIHIWQVSTGHLLCVLGHHYQPVTVLAFTDDGSHFVSAAEDNMAMVWSMYSVITESDSPPRHRWSDHSLPVTDLYVGHGGIRARVATAALDNTVRLYELHSGTCLCRVVLDSAVTSVTMDAADMMLFAGAANGNIYQCNFFQAPAKTELHLDSSDGDKKLLFTGHSLKVTCLCTSLDSTQLVSGSQDCTVKVWDIPGRVCLRTLQHKGSITNVRFCPWSESRLGGKWAPVIQSFQRHLYGTGAEDGKDDAVTMYRPPGAHIEEEDDVEDVMTAIGGQQQQQQQQQQQEKCSVEHEIEGPSRAELQRQNQELRAANKELYAMIQKEIMEHRETVGEEHG